MSTSSWGRELKYQPSYCCITCQMSTSSWGRELKCQLTNQDGCMTCVDLFVRSWVEIPTFSNMLLCNSGRPLREVVSWNVVYETIISHLYSRPLREVVSWNTSPTYGSLTVNRSTSSWGRELKYWLMYSQIMLNLVDLFVRSWVEISICREFNVNEEVDLFVRSWVEIPLTTSEALASPSTSSWGRELKYFRGLY